jgi:L-fuconate dehydratase
MAKITSMEVLDVRFPTSRELDGSDAMNLDPDYSAAYVVLHTDGGPDGYGLTFTIGRGNDVQAAASKALEHHVIGREVPQDAAALAALSSALIGDSQFRWLGPEKGVAHMAIGAVVNAAWDLAARRANRPLWRFLAEMRPEELVGLVDFRYLSDALTEQEALDIVRAAEPGRQERTGRILRDGYRAYSTSPGWLGYSDAKLVRLAEQAVADGFSMIKLKVGGDLDDDVRRMKLARETVGAGIRIAVDANQRWDVAAAIQWMAALAPYDPYWIEEPTSPDDVLGHAAIAKAIAPIGVATGEMCQNRVVFKQFLQANAISFLQVDSCRMGGVNEVLAVLLLAEKFGVPVCPHAGGVGLCEYVQHLAIYDYVAVSGSLENRLCEYVDHLHEHFVDPCTIRNARYTVPTRPGYSITMKPESIDTYEFPTGKFWRMA